MQDTQLRVFQVAEIEVSYIPSRVGDAIRVSSSHECFEVFMDFWNLKTIQYRETFCAMYLNRAKRVIGIHEHSVGGSSSTVVDVKQLLGVALVANASCIIIAHNHPSGILKPSQADIDLTMKVKEACQFMELTLLDHLIINDHTYYSFADEGTI